MKTNSITTCISLTLETILINETICLARLAMLSFSLFKVRKIISKFFFLINKVQGNFSILGKLNLILNLISSTEKLRHDENITVQNAQQPSWAGRNNLKGKHDLMKQHLP